MATFLPLTPPGNQFHGQLAGFYRQGLSKSLLSLYVFPQNGVVKGLRDKNRNGQSTEICFLIIWSRSCSQESLEGVSQE